jgi:transcriptional regulator with XRE-family HTH domain
MEQTFWVELITYTAAAGLHDYQLAQLADVDTTRLSRLRCGRITPSAEDVEKLAKALGVAISVLEPGALDLPRGDAA